MVKILLTDIARSWWLAEEERLAKPVLWDQFSTCFNERFFPKTAKREMEQRFIHLKQFDKSVDANATEFLRLSRFAPSMVENEEDRANRFQHGLRWEIQKLLTSQQLETYSQVLTVASRVEMVMGHENKIKDPTR